MFAQEHVGRLHRLLHSQSRSNSFGCIVRPVDQTYTWNVDTYLCSHLKFSSQNSLLFVNFPKFFFFKVSLRVFSPALPSSFISIFSVEEQRGGSSVGRPKPPSFLFPRLFAGFHDYLNGAGRQPQPHDAQPLPGGWPRRGMPLSSLSHQSCQLCCTTILLMIFSIFLHNNIVNIFWLFFKSICTTSSQRLIVHKVIQTHP